MIPKIAHQTAKTKHLRRRERMLHEKLKRTLHDWKVILWDDEDNLRMVKEHFPVYFDAFHGLPHGVMRADIARYMYMALYGGFYFDTDYEILKYIDDDFLRHACVIPKSREQDDPDNGSGFIRLGNAVFGSEAGHFFWRDLLDSFFSNVNVQNTRRDEIEATSGPEFVTKVYLATADRYHDIVLPDRRLFHSPVSRRPLVDSFQSYGIHHCFGSWRGTSFPAKIKRLVRRTMRG